MSWLDNIDAAAAKKGKKVETFWQFVKFIVVSLGACIVQVVSLAILYNIPAIKELSDTAFHWWVFDYPVIEGERCGLALFISANVADTGSKLTLIMDRNLGDNVSWISKGDYITAGGSETDYGDYGNNGLGPITVLNYLNTQTSSWKNINPIESYIYDDLNGITNFYCYQKLAITSGVGKLTSRYGGTINLTGTMRARLLTLEESNTLKANNNGTVPKWLYGNLSGSNTTRLSLGYWLLTANPTYYSNVNEMYYDGNVVGHYGASNGTEFGARPVIEMYK
mgnify:CR=1 FL=1